MSPHALAVEASQSRIEASQSRIEVSEARVPAADWDAFAQDCGASFWGAAGGMRLWQLKHHAAHRIRQYEIHVWAGGARTKVGQCAVGFGRRQRVFSEGIQLLPEHKGLWRDCLDAVMRHLGPGRYVYGSDWCLDGAREGEIAAMPGFAVEKVDRYMVEAVEFSRWQDWDAYFRAISNNVRRNIKNAEKRHQGMAVSVRRQGRTILDVPRLARCRSGMYRRKNVRFSLARMLVNYVLRTGLLRDHVVSSVVYGDGKALATFAGVAYGDNVFYIDGGSQDDCAGAAWVMKMRLFRELYDRAPHGRFVMGSVDLEGAPFPEGEWKSEVRYRQDCRVTGLPTSVVTFTYGGHGNVVPLRAGQRASGAKPEAGTLTAARVGGNA